MSRRNPLGETAAEFSAHCRQMDKDQGRSADLNEELDPDKMGDGYKSSDSMNEEVLRLLCLDLWDFINRKAERDIEQGVPMDGLGDGFYAILRQRVIEALNLDEREEYNVDTRYRS